MKLIDIIGITFIIAAALAFSGCAGLPSDGKAASAAGTDRENRVATLGSRIRHDGGHDCRDPRTASPVVRICAKDLAKTGAPDTGNAIKSRVPSLRWPIGH